MVPLRDIWELSTEFTKIIHRIYSITLILSSQI